jgi:enoyl-CoA hydratase
MTLEFSASDDVRHSIDDGVLWVTIDRPEKRNPLSLGVLERLRCIFSSAADDEDIRVAVVTGAGSKAFSAGGDITELSRVRSRDDAEMLSQHGTAALDAVRRFPIPVIARLNGLALGGGAELALACDMRYAATAAKLGFVHGRLCISAPWGGGEDLVRLVGPSRAVHLMATAAILTSEEARALGLIELVCPEELEFESWFEERVAVFRRQPRRLLYTFKAIARAPRGGDAAETARRIREQFAQLWCHDDHWDALARADGAGS